ncbi:type II CAAX endopeptidase family protein [Raineyella sp.]|uniref:CPBP family intramembrane glutamic endopeptidase n=1 Tax=Raineyella sp. TaxID=1911550 RepID=UPI002B204535|nr:type II CAAX endopeptidase family protein [Raineyella sp.]MEA5154215.1 type II CAAX endopeptidase family protein [Raineyella sp.]
MTRPGRTALLPPPPALPVRSQDYYGFLRTPRYRWWKGLLAALALLVGFLVVDGVLAAAGLIVDVILGAVSPQDLRGAANGVIPIGPATFIGNNLGLALLIPLVMLLARVFFGQTPGWSASVVGRFRWRWLGWCLLVVGLPWCVLLTVSTAATGGFPTPVLTPSVWLMLGLTLLTTPLQCAGEEWAFRGLLPRCFAAMVPQPAVGTVVGVAVSSLLFMTAHAAADPWLNAFYFGFGLVMSALTWRTGGLEAAVMFHTANNLTGLIPVVLTGDYASIGDRGAGSGSPAVLLPLAVGVGLVFLTDLVRRRRGVTRTAAPGLDLLPPPAMTSLPPAGMSFPPAGTSLPPARDSDSRESGDSLGPYEHRDQPPGPGGEQRP